MKKQDNESTAALDVRTIESRKYLELLGVFAASPPMRLIFDSSPRHRELNVG